MESGTLIITQDDIRRTLTLADYIPIIEDVHIRHALNQIYTPGMLHADVEEGEFHLKTGGILFTENEYYGLKINGGFFENKKKYNLPNILGIIYICNAQNGYPLAIMDSVLISKYRTAAATAVAAKYLAPQTDIRLGIFGYGSQAEVQIEAAREICSVSGITVSGKNMAKANQFAERISDAYKIPVSVASIERTARTSNFLITTTPAREYYIEKEWINPGTFIAAIGADSPGKQELDPKLVASSIVIADIKSQVCRAGESQHAIKQNLMTANDITAELGEIIIQRKNIHDSKNIIIYDSTGTALQDIGIGVKIYEKLVHTDCLKTQLAN